MKLKTLLTDPEICQAIAESVGATSADDVEITVTDDGEVYVEIEVTLANLKKVARKRKARASKADD